MAQEKTSQEATGMTLVRKDLAGTVAMSMNRDRGVHIKGLQEFESANMVTDCMQR